MRRFLLVAVAALLVGSCAGAPKKKSKTVRPPEQAEVKTQSTAEMDREILAETKARASVELSCPTDLLVARCTSHDAHGGCIAVVVKGCDKTLEYNFGTE